MRQWRITTAAAGIAFGLVVGAAAGQDVNRSVGVLDGLSDLPAPMVRVPESGPATTDPVAVPTPTAATAGLVLLAAVVALRFAQKAFARQVDRT